MAIMFAALIYWGLNNYRQSASAIQRISQTNTEPAITNAIFKSVMESDLHLNYFILTNDTTQYRLFLDRKTETDSLLSLLGSYNNDGIPQLPEVDSLKLILNEKNDVSNLLVELKQRQKAQFFTEQALNRIKTQLSDSAFIDRAIIQSQKQVAKRDTIEKFDFISRPDNYDGIGGFFRKLFGREVVRTDTVKSLEEHISYNLETLVDSSIVRNYFVDTTLVAVKSILLDVLEEEIRLQNDVLAIEMEVLSYNEQLLTKIRELLEEITALNEEALFTQQRNAIENINKAHKQAFVIMALGILFGIVLLLILGKDIAKTNLYRRILEQEKDRAEALAQAKEIFLSKMSHEIRTPIHSISGFSQLLEEEYLEGKQKKLLAGISNANHYLNELIENLLEQAKLNAGTYAIKQSEVFIPEVCASMEVLFNHREEEHQNTFYVSYSKNLKEIALLTDEIKLKQILINLLGNAFKFTRNGRISLEIALKGIAEAHYLQLIISDTGKGIHKSDQETIFEPFSQGVYGETPETGGAGLGLAITKNIVESFGGNISLTSQPSKGSRFVIEFPVATIPFIPKNHEKSNNSAVFWPINVLAVEDDEWNALLLENYVSSHVNTFTLFENAEDAFDHFISHKIEYDILVTDLNLPGISGRDLFERIRALQEKPLPSVALSASLGKIEIQELKELGFSDALGKPFTKNDILRTIRQVLHLESTSLESNSKDDSVLDEPTSIDKKDALIANAFKQLSAFLPNNPNDQAAFLERFFASISEKIHSFEQALKQQNPSELKRCAHQLISSLEQIGVSKQSENLHSIEVCVTLGKNERAFELGQEIAPYLNAFVKELADYKESNESTSP